MGECHQYNYFTIRLQDADMTLILTDPVDLRYQDGDLNGVLVILGTPMAPINPTKGVATTAAFLAPAVEGHYEAQSSVAMLCDGVGGVVEALKGVCDAPPDSTWIPTETSELHGVTGIAQTAKGGRVWGGQFIARTTGEEQTDIAVAAEFGVDTHGPVIHRYGLIVTANADGDKAGSGEDILIRLTNKPGGAPWRDGIAFVSSGGVFPVSGTILRAEPATVSRGIDLGALNITDVAIAVPGFQVSGYPVELRGARLDIRTHSEELNITGISTLAGNTIPAGAMVLGVSVRVLESILGATTFSIGVFNAINRYGMEISTIVGSTHGSCGISQPSIYTSNTQLIITTNIIPSDSTGVICITFHYLVVVPPTD